MSRKKIIIIILIILITNVATVFITKQKFDNIIMGKQQENTTYSEFTEQANTLISNLKKGYPSLKEQITTVSAYPGNQDINKLWVNSTFDIINNDLSYPEKRDIYIFNNEKDIVTKVTFCYEPKINDKLYLSVNRLINSENNTENPKSSLCIVFSNSITTKGMFIQIVTTSNKEAIYNDIFIQKLANENSEITSKVQDIIIKNSY